MAYLENSGGYESIVWITDRHGREFSCYENDLKNIEQFKEMNEKLREKCVDVNNIVGTDRW